MSKFKNINKFLFILVSGLLISGCSFSNSPKKAEISLGNGTMPENVENQTEENATNEDVADIEKEDAAAVQNVQDVENYKKNDSTAAVNAPETPEKTEAPAAPEEKAPAFKINDRLVDWGFQKSSGRKIDTIIIHSSYNAVGDDPYDLDDIIKKEYKPAGVSPHYIISREGKIYRLVKDENIAYHAGVSEVPDGRTNVNSFSIGIEVVGKKDEGPSSAQYSSLKKLISYLKDEYKIKYVLGHSDIAPGRKDDPWNLEWSKIGGKDK